jgi:hypothetical protein
LSCRAPCDIANWFSMPRHCKEKVSGTLSAKQVVTK